MQPEKVARREGPRERTWADQVAPPLADDIMVPPAPAAHSSEAVGQEMPAKGRAAGGRAPGARRTRRTWWGGSLFVGEGWQGGWGAALNRSCVVPLS